MDNLKIDETGMNAGKVWNILSHTGSGISIQELRKQLALTFDQVFAAIRWLAKDYNIGLANHEGNLMLIGVQADLPKNTR